MEVNAIHRHARVSARKVRLVLNAVRGQKVDDALAVLRFLPSPSARLVEKVVKSAAANAENNYSLAPSSLYIKNAFADPSRTLKRMRAKSRGRGGAILKRTSHITVVVEDKER